MCVIRIALAIGLTSAATLASVVVGTRTALASQGLYWPFSTVSTSQYQRIDQGWDVQTSAAGAVYAVAAGWVYEANQNAGGFGDDYPYEVLDSAVSLNGRTYTDIYYGHVHSSAAYVSPSPFGTHVQAGQLIAVTNSIECGNGVWQTDARCNGSNAPAGWLEIGFGNSAPAAPHKCTVYGYGPPPTGDSNCNFYPSSSSCTTYAQAASYTPEPTTPGDDMCSVLFGSPVYSSQTPSSWVAAFAAGGTNGLWYFDPNRSTNPGQPTNLQVATGTSPSIAQQPNGKWVAAFVAAGSNILWSYQSKYIGTKTPPGSPADNLGVKTGTSPSIAELSDGSYDIAFDGAGTPYLWVWQSAKSTNRGWNTGLQVAAGTSPSIAQQPNGQYVAAFVAAGSNVLWIYQSKYIGNTQTPPGSSAANLQVATGTSPSITQQPNGQWIAAWDAAGTNNLWTWDSSLPKNQGVNRQLSVAAGTNPGISQV